MGELVVSVLAQGRKFNALVDTGASHLTLPLAWRNKFNGLKTLGEEEMLLADQSLYKAEVCGPFEMQIEGFRTIATEVIFIDMKPNNGEYEPLLGYIPLEQSRAVVDLTEHKLVKGKAFRLKKADGPVVITPEGSPCLLGATALETLAFAADAANKILIPVVAPFAGADGREG